jgi:hypothetical protein
LSSGFYFWCYLLRNEGAGITFALIQNNNFREVLRGVAKQRQDGQPLTATFYFVFFNFSF